MQEIYLKRRIKIINFVVFLRSNFKKDKMNNQDNGNVQLNSARNEFNDRVGVKSFLGRTKKVAWAGVRRFRSI